ncbi:MAG: type II toxin-antitoxin system RelE/ParE family toxin [bacterium]|nr:type II toxin-antitoxin system RelE/ParE family toxin [bacterium]
MEEALPFEVRNYVTPSGNKPFQEWVKSIRDIRARTAIRERVYRLQRGILGDCKAIGQGIYESRIHFGPGYRLYIGRDAAVIVILLCGGDKRTQKRDIERAKTFWEDYNQRKV